MVREQKEFFSLIVLAEKIARYARGNFAMCKTDRFVFPSY